MVLGRLDGANLREYLGRGGLWFADDFHDEEEFDQFLQQIQRVLPEALPVELDVSPVFDDSGHLSILMAWNTDAGDGLEWADDPTYPANYSTYAFKFMTNL